MIRTLSSSIVGDIRRFGIRPSTGFKTEWHKEWTATVDEAFAALPYDAMMDPKVVRAIWDSPALGERKIVIFRDHDRPVGVLPLEKRGTLSWQLLTQFVMPYGCFHVMPEYVDSAVWSLGRYMNCANVVFVRPPSDPSLLTPEVSWVVDLTPNFSDLLRRCDYVHEARRCRKKSAALTIYEDRYEDLPIALEHWFKKWSGRGHAYTANRRPQLMASFRAMASLGKLKTHSLYLGDQFAGMNIHYVGPKTVYFMVTVGLEEFRQHYVGIRAILEALEWACGTGASTFDMLTEWPHYKKKWAVPRCESHHLHVGPARSQTTVLAFSYAESLYWKAMYKLKLMT